MEMNRASTFRKKKRLTPARSRNGEHQEKLRVDVDAPELGRLVAAVVSVDGLDLLHVLLRDVEVEDLQVLLQPLHLGCLGDHHRLLLKTPPEHQLHRRLAVLVSQLL